MGAFSFDVCGRRAAAARRVDGLGQAAAGPQQDPETRHFRRFAIGLAMRQTWPGRSRQSAAAKRRGPRVSPQSESNAPCHFLNSQEARTNPTKSSF